MRLAGQELHGDGGAELRAMIGYARRLLSQAVEAGWSTGVLTRADAVLSSMPDARDIEALMQQIAADAQAAPRVVPRFSESGRVGQLVHGIGAAAASRVAAELLVLALAVEIDPPSRTLCGYLRGGPSGSALTVGLLMLIFGEERAADVLMALGSGAPLRRHRLVEVVDKGSDLVAAATVRAAPRLLRWLVEPPGLDDEVAEFARLQLPDPEPALTPAALRTVDKAIEETRAFLVKQRERLRATGRAQIDLVLRGPRGAGRAEIAVEAARRLGLPLLICDVPALAGQPSPPEAAAALLREAVLLDAQILLTGAESLTTADEATGRLRQALGVAAGPLLLSSSGVEQPRLAAGRMLVQREVRLAGMEDREPIWAEVLPEVPAEEVASLYRVGVGAIARIADGARLRAAVRGNEAASTEDVAQAVRAEFETDLGTVAQRVDVSQRWDDLVVPDDTGRTIAEIVDQLRHRATVLGKWGFARKLGKGLGTTALFSGEPGTGKSMVAGLIAKELGLELYQIDLSRVLSKWIGETEKNLAKVFDAAETGHVVLLFDEADALLGKRTVDVKSANDRYANIETNYILQRLEQFHGVAILTSNLQSSIDPALSRRLSFELRFPFPDEEQRAELWRRMLPTELPIDGEIDYRHLAERFELSGGYIRNIVLRAAYLAAADSDALTMAHLLRAAEYEYRDHGMLVAKGRLKT
jgi:hypothetical protein